MHPVLRLGIKTLRHATAETPMAVLVFAPERRWKGGVRGGGGGAAEDVNRMQQRTEKENWRMPSPLV